MLLLLSRIFANRYFFQGKWRPLRFIRTNLTRCQHEPGNGDAAAQPQQWRHRGTRQRRASFTRHISKCDAAALHFTRAIALRLLAGQSAWHVAHVTCARFMAACHNAAVQARDFILHQVVRFTLPCTPRLALNWHCSSRAQLSYFTVGGGPPTPPIGTIPSAGQPADTSAAATAAICRSHRRPHLAIATTSITAILSN